MRSRILLAVGLSCLLGLPSGAQEIPEIDPCFDYTQLGPTDQHVWELIGASKLGFGELYDLAIQGRKEGRVRAYALVEGREGFPGFHRFDVLSKGKDDAIERTYVRIGHADGKLLAEKDVKENLCVREASNYKTPQELWDEMNPVKLNLKAAVVEVSKEVFKKNPAKPFEAEYVPGLKPRFELTMYNFQEKNGLPRRWSVNLSAVKFRMERRILIDRFPGEPLRRGVPTEHPNGMYTYDLREGDGEQVGKDAIVKVNYRLFRLDGVKLVDSYAARRPHRFALDAAPLPGMGFGIEGMRVGGRRKMVLPAALAYGPNGSAQLGVPPNAVVVVDLDVLELGEEEE